MTLEEYYHLTGGEYERTLIRMRNEAMVRRFLRMFREDESFDQLVAAMAAGDDEAAFMAVHTLKGCALSVGLEDLSTSAWALTENLRNGRKPGADDLYQRVCRDYETAIRGLDQLGE